MSTVIIIDRHCQICSVQPREAESATCATFSQSQNQQFNPKKNEEKEREVEAAIC